VLLPCARLRPFWTAAITFAGLVALTNVRSGADDWPEWRGRGRVGIWNETGVVATLPEGGLPVSWRTPIRAGYSGPAVAGGRVFITDSQRIKANEAVERAIALDKLTGKEIRRSRSSDSEPGYNQPIIIEAGGTRQLIIFHPDGFSTPVIGGEYVYGIDNDGQLRCLE